MMTVRLSVVTLRMLYVCSEMSLVLMVITPRTIFSDVAAWSSFDWLSESTRTPRSTA